MSILASILHHNLRGLLRIRYLLVEALSKVTVVILTLLHIIRACFTSDVSRSQLHAAWAKLRSHFALNDIIVI
jgi:hypothetical protein